MDKPINVLIVDDELLVRQGLRSTIDWLRYGMQVAGEAANGEAALDLYERLQPEVIITDIVMPRMDGIALAKEIRRRDPHCKILFLSCHGEFTYAQEGIRVGAAGYVLKTSLDHDEMHEYLSSIAHEVQKQRQEEAVRHHRGTGLPEQSGAASTASLTALWRRWLTRRQPEDEQRLLARVKEWWPDAEGKWIDIALITAEHEQHVLADDAELLPAWQPAMLLSFLDTTGQRIAASTAELWPLLESRLIAAKQRVPSLVWRCRPARRLEEVLQNWLRLRQYRKIELKYRIPARLESDAVLTAIEYIEDRLAEGPSTAEIAEHAGMSRSHFSLLFKKETGCSLIEFIYKIRLERACLLLETTDLKAHVISEKVGIHNFKHFSRWFKQMTGLTPTEYRQTRRIAPALSAQQTTALTNTPG